MERKFQSVPLTAAVGNDDSVHVKSFRYFQPTNFVKGITILLHSFQNHSGSLPTRLSRNILFLSVSNPETAILLRLGLFTDAELRSPHSLSGSSSFIVYFALFVVATITITFLWASISFNALYHGCLCNCSNVPQPNESHAQLIIKCLSGCNEI